MTDNGPVQLPREQLGNVRIEILGHPDYMEADRLAFISELPNYMRAQGISAEISYKEPGGMGLPPLEVITVYIVDHAQDEVLGAIVLASISGAWRWAKDRIRRWRHSEAGGDDEVGADAPDREASIVVRVRREGESIVETSVTLETADLSPEQLAEIMSRLTEISTRDRSAPKTKQP